MTIVAIREKLSNYMKIADDKKVKAMYALLKEDIKLEERISIEQYNNEIAEAEAEYKRGEFISHEEMIQKIKQW